MTKVSKGRIREVPVKTLRIAKRALERLPNDKEMPSRCEVCGSHDFFWVDGFGWLCGYAPIMKRLEKPNND